MLLSMKGYYMNILPTLNNILLISKNKEKFQNEIKVLRNHERDKAMALISLFVAIPIFFIFSSFFGLVVNLLLTSLTSLILSPILARISDNFFTKKISKLFLTELNQKILVNEGTLASIDCKLDESLKLLKENNYIINLDIEDIPLQIRDAVSTIVGYVRGEKKTSDLILALKDVNLNYKFMEEYFNNIKTDEQLSTNSTYER